KGVENAGADMICVLASTYVEPYNVPANWAPLYEMKEHVSIPVLGNGGLLSLEEGRNKCQNLDGFLIGQATFGNPWVFSQVNSQMSFGDKLPTIKNHAQFLIESKGEVVGTREIRKHLLSYVKHFTGAKAFRSDLAHVDSMEKINHVLDDIHMAVTQTS
ncbi:MAG: tRNA-dihydrouridine synthase, partial [Candidatus Margulisbacteria bacterium]|nr:tRNA-dihydrouridine synthase [Candidatus Margulisiibacteriota bacterium]